MRNVCGWSVVSLMVLSGLASAQQTQPRQPNVRPGTQPGFQQPPVAGQQQHQQSDQQIAAVIAICNRNEVATAKFAMDKLQSSEAKEIAAMLVKDHTETANKFSKWAGPAANVNTGAQPAAGTRETDRREERLDNEQSRTAPATKPNNPAIASNQQPHVALKPATGGLDWVALHQELADEGLASCKKELSRYEGNEFDKAFLGHQIGGHLMAAANLKVLRRHASSQLGAEINEALAGTESHLKKIRDLMEEKKDEKNK